jgi:hypothetical protein
LRCQVLLEFCPTCRADTAEGVVAAERFRHGAVEQVLKPPFHALDEHERFYRGTRAEQELGEVGSPELVLEDADVVGCVQPLELVQPGEVRRPGVPEGAVGPVELLGRIVAVVRCVDRFGHSAKSTVPPSKLGGDPEGAWRRFVVQNQRFHRASSKGGRGHPKTPTTARNRTVYRLFLRPV